MRICEEQLEGSEDSKHDEYKVKGPRELVDIVKSRVGYSVSEVGRRALELMLLRTSKIYTKGLRLLVKELLLPSQVDVVG
nr:hypothetical protein [Tanacetum cinerariifolium]